MFFPDAFNFFLSLVGLTPFLCFACCYWFQKRSKYVCLYTLFPVRASRSILKKFHAVITHTMNWFVHHKRIQTTYWSIWITLQINWIIWLFEICSNLISYAGVWNYKDTEIIPNSSLCYKTKTLFAYTWNCYLIWLANLETSKVDE